MAEIYSSDFFNDTMGRAAVYEYFSYVLKLPVEQEFIGLSKKYVEVFANLSSEYNNDDMAYGVEILKKYVELEESTKDTASLLEELNIQWTSIFLTGASNVPCSSSVAITGMEMDAPWERVMEYYEIRGFKKPEDYTESDDHIAMELLFMREMNGLIIDMHNKGLDENIKDVLKEQYVFLNNYMYDWISSACREMASFCENTGFKYPLYLAVSHLLLGFLSYDKEYLAEATE